LTIKFTHEQQPITSPKSESSDQKPICDPKVKLATTEVRRNLQTLAQ
jgi:hypothetical protein